MNKENQEVEEIFEPVKKEVKRPLMKAISSVLTPLAIAAIVYGIVIYALQMLDYKRIEEKVEAEMNGEATSVGTLTVSTGNATKYSSWKDYVENSSIFGWSDESRAKALNEYPTKSSYLDAVKEAKLEGASEMFKADTALIFGVIGLFVGIVAHCAYKKGQEE